MIGWVELTRLLGKIEEKMENPRKIRLIRTHLRHDKEYEVSVRPPFRYGDFTILAAKIKGK